MFNATPRFTFKSSAGRDPLQDARSSSITPIHSSLTSRTHIDVDADEILEESSTNSAEDPHPWSNVDRSLFSHNQPFPDGQDEAASMVHLMHVKRPRASSASSSESRHVEHTNTRSLFSPGGTSSSPPYRLTMQSPAKASTSGSSPHRPVRPKFILPETADTVDGLPVAEIFSPHLRKARYVPGGAASTVRDWILDIRNQSSWERVSSAPIRVVEVVRDDRVTLMTDEEDMRWVLIGERVDSTMRAVVQAGSKLDIQGPVWDVQIDSTLWRIGTSWHLLDVS